MLLPVPLLLLASAHAEIPLPAYPECAHDALDRCPSDLREDDWDQVSWIPDASAGTVLPAELEIGSGIACDVAWRHETGRWDAPIAIVDSGIDWSERSLANKVLLNAGELPLPMDAGGTALDTYDADGNGVVNVQDWAQDPRVDEARGVDVADGLLDPSDLIWTFSDGVDDDGNGFVDDVAGWDFLHDDNDPYADTTDSLYASHGTGVMEEAAQEGGDGGGIGVCPNCPILPLRHGEAIITDGDRVGMAISYATDRGARVVGMALGGLTHSVLTEEAIAYAEAHEVVIVAAAGDENSWHHNLPAVHAPILYVHSIRGNSASEEEGGVTSFLSFFNCNNFGPRLDLVAPSRGCATGSVARISGAAGLIVSAGLSAGTDLSASEVRALLRGTADDVSLSAADLALVKTYPSKPGFDAYYGYGRANVGRSVERVVGGEIPPVADIVSPDWFDWADGDLVVTGRVAAPYASSVSWKLEAGEGQEPGSWEEVASGSGPVDGEIATVDVSGYGEHTPEDLGPAGVVERTAAAHEPLVTLRLTVTDGEGRISQDRRGVWVYDDPDRLPGFPIRLEGSGEPGATLADLDGDGIFEIVAATGGGVVHAWHGDGEEVEGFPVSTAPSPMLTAHGAAPAHASGAVQGAGETIVALPAVGDVDGDGEPEVVVASFAGGLYAWNADGTAVSGFPVRSVGRANEEYGTGDTWDQGFAAAPALGDVDGDEDLEIVAVGMDQRLYAFDGDGALLAGYPLAVCEPGLCADGPGARIVSSPALGDADGDGDLDAIFGSNEVPQGAAGVVYAVDLATATVWDGFPKKRAGLINQAILPVIGEGHPSSVALADLDGDGDSEWMTNSMLGSIGPVDEEMTEVVDALWLRDGFGSGSNVYGENAFLSLANNPSYGDLDGDGVPDPMSGGSGAFWVVSLAGTTILEYQHGVLAWSGADGTAFPGFPRQVEDVSFLNAATVADLTGDDVPEVIYGTGGYRIHAWDKDGNLAGGWPKFTGGWLLGAASVGDVDGDGWLDVVATTREGWLFAWTTDGRADQELEWPLARHDAQNTGNYATALPTQEGPPRGCCKKRKADRRDAILLLLLPAVLLRRRR